MHASIAYLISGFS